jgi:uncharacterized membrane protein YraQ (UPF0718 family)
LKVPHLDDVIFAIPRKLFPRQTFWHVVFRRILFAVIVAVFVSIFVMLTIDRAQF